MTFVVFAGSLVDRTTGQPLPDVTVAVGSAHAISRADGSFRLNAPHAGHAIVSVSSDDVPPQQFPVTIASKSRVVLRVCSTTLDYNCGPPQ